MYAKSTAPVASQPIRPPANQVSLLASHHVPRSLVMRGCRQVRSLPPVDSAPVRLFPALGKVCHRHRRDDGIARIAPETNQTALHQENEIHSPLMR